MSISANSCAIRLPRTLAILAALISLSFAVQAYAQPALTQLSEDTFTDSPSQHETEVEPSAFTYGSTIVTAFQVARIYGGGGADIGFSTSTDGGKTWTNGYLPGITIYEGNGQNSAASDASVAYDALHKVWLISTLPIGASNNTVAVSSSTDGINWSKPFTVTSKGSADKNWIVCDNTASSPYYGHCYSEWDDTSLGDFIQMSTSVDGGQTWGPALGTATNDYGIGGVPVVQPKGKVIVPILGFNGDVIAFTSANGGKTWTKSVNVATYMPHGEDGGIRAAGLISSAIDAAGKVYVFWPDCRFRTNCSSNDIVYSTSTTGTKWAAVKRVPIDATTSTVDHFITGAAIAPGTKGAKAQIGLAYYYYPVSACGSKCELYAGFIQTTSAGKTWTTAESLAGPMQLTWLPQTFSGTMVADYIAVGFGGGKAFPIFAAAQKNAGSLFHEAIYTTTAGQEIPTLESEVMSAEGDQPVPNAHSDRGPMEYLDQEHLIPIPPKNPPKPN